MKYYIMECEGPYPLSPIRSSPKLPGGTWYKGRMLTIEVPDKLEYVLDSNRPGNIAAMYLKGVPVMRNDLLEAITSAGVDNLQLYPATVIDPEKNKVYANFTAFNIVGVVACADMSKSKLFGNSNSSMVDIDFDSLFIDESKTNGLLMFRLAEAVSAIVVHEKVKAAIEKAGIKGMEFYEPGEWSG